MKLRLDDVHVVYEPSVRALQGVSLTIEQGEFVAITGASGSGKSTLLNVIALLDRPTAGTYHIDGTDVSGLPETRRAAVRATGLGFVFQSFHLIGGRSMLENAQLGMVYAGVPRRDRLRRAREALDLVGLGDSSARATRLASGGERQRAAIARAIAAGARLIVADEPTGNLDTANSELVMKELARLNDLGHTVVLVTHDEDTARYASRRIHMRDGVIVRDDRSAPARLRADAPEAEPGTGRRPRVRGVDVVAEAAASLLSRPGRAAALAGAVALAVGLAVATLGLANSASAQVSDRFDSRQNREVTLERQSAESGTAVDSGQSDVAFSAASMERLSRVAGVQAVAFVGTAAATDVHVGAVKHSAVPVFHVSGDLSEAAEVTVYGGGPCCRDLGPSDVLVGAHAAELLGIGPVALDPVVTIDGAPYRVAGIVTEARRDPSFLDAVLLPAGDGMGGPDISIARAMLRVAPGAAQQVAGQAAVAADPYEPGRLTVRAPADPRDLREEIESDVRTTLIVLTVVAMLAAVVSLANATVVSVIERTGEIGLRRALGARKADIRRGMLAEAVMVGLLGGVVGTYGGALAVLAVTITRGWVPVFDLRIVPVAVAAGVVVALVGSALAVWRASRIEPSQALRAA